VVLQPNQRTGRKYQEIDTRMSLKPLFLVLDFLDLLQRSFKILSFAPCITVPLIRRSLP
jgi:hypothetical protein